MSDHPVTIFPIGKKSKKALKRLKRGADEQLLAEIRERLTEAGIPAEALPVILLYEKKPKRRSWKRQVGLLKLP